MKSAETNLLLSTLWVKIKLCSTLILLKLSLYAGSAGQPMGVILNMDGDVCLIFNLPGRLELIGKSIRKEAMSYIKLNQFFFKSQKHCFICNFRDAFHFNLFLKHPSRKIDTKNFKYKCFIMKQTCRSTCSGGILKINEK